jgi:N-formylglutamate amidohydrolase
MTCLDGGKRMDTFDQLSDPTVPPIPLVVHVPHCATGVPARYRDELVIGDDELARELLLMTDHYTDELAMSAVAMGGVVFRNRVSRLVMDPERFEDDAKEEMAKRGMGAVYMRRHDGTPLRAPSYSAARRAKVMAELYTPYHRALEDLVTRNLDEHGMSFIVDCHSFPSRALPYEDAGQVRPGLCIGVDEPHVDAEVVCGWQVAAQRAGVSTGINTPFGGSFVPTRYFGTERRVRSMMVEVRRDLYMDEGTGGKIAGFDDVRRLVAELLDVVVASIPAGRRA